MRARRIIKGLLPIIVIALAVAAMNYLVNSKAARKQPELREKVWQVDVIAASRQTLSPGITLYGRVESPEQLQAAAPGAGIVEQVLVRSGDTVKKSQTLVRLDRRDFESQLIQAKSEMMDIRSQSDELKIRHSSNQSSLTTEKELLQLAEDEVERMRKLKNQNLGADSVLSEARVALGRQQLSVQNRQFEVESFPARLQMLEAKQSKFSVKLKDAKLMIERSQVVAPFDAVITSAPVSVGDRVAIGQTLVSLYPVQSLEIRAHIPYRYVADIQAAISQTKIPMAQWRRQDEILSFGLKRLSGDAKPSGLDAYFDTGEASQALRPGELLSLNLSLPLENDVFAIPFQAIYGNSRIFLLRENRLVGIDVETVGQFFRADKGAQLLVRSEKINDGDAIVVTHLPNAVTGLKVRTVENDTAQ